MNFKLIFSGLIAMFAVAFITTVHAATLLTVDPLDIVTRDKLDENGDPVIGRGGRIVQEEVSRTGSYFKMAGSEASLSSGSAGGIILGTYQDYTLNDGPHVEKEGKGYSQDAVISESTAVSTFQFFGVTTYIGLNAISNQTGNAAPAPEIFMGDCISGICGLTAELSAWEVFWNGNVFEQGPRPSNAGPFTLAEGTFNQLTNEYVLEWQSQVKGGAFNGQLALWHLEGTVSEISTVPVPSAVWLFGSGLIGLVGVARRKNINY